MFFSESDLIHSYTRAQALADGNLIDVTKTAREAGFTFPVALTLSAHADCVLWSEEDNERKGACQDMSGRLWDVLYMAAIAARAAKRKSEPADRITFSLYRVPREGQAIKPRLVTLEAVCGPGDVGEPVITIMQPGED